jgi:hypothetical protein
MIFSELNRRPGDSPSSSGMAPPRDFEVINADELAEVIRKKIHDPEIAALGITGALTSSATTDLVDFPPLRPCGGQGGQPRPQDLPCSAKLTRLCCGGSSLWWRCSSTGRGPFAAKAASVPGNLIAVIASLPRGCANGVASHYRAVIGVCFTQIRLGEQL